MGNVKSGKIHLQNKFSQNWSYTFPLFLVQRMDLWRDKILEISDLL
jgi:hypothetical protein